MIFSWFDASEAKAFGDSLARFFVAGAPNEKHYGDKAFELKVQKVLKQMADQIARFKQQHKLNMYKKAQLGNAFRWGLIDAGIDTKYTEQLTQWLVLQLG